MATPTASQLSIDGSASPRFSAVIVGEGTLPIRCGELLLRAGHQVCGVISPDDAVRRWARTHGVRAVEPGDDPVALVRDAAVDYLFSIVNYSVLPAEMLALPRRCAINYHDGPLPRYAGMYATSWALLHGETRHAVTWHVATELVDGGDIFVQEPVDIAPDDTAVSLNLRCYDAAARAFERLIPTLAAGTSPTPQDLEQRTYFGLHRRPEGGGLLRWREGAEAIGARARALDFGPYPNALGLARVDLGTEILHLARGHLGDPSAARPGTIVAVSASGISVATSTRDYVITELRDVGGPIRPILPLLQQAGLTVGDRLPDLDDHAWSAHVERMADLARRETFWRRRLAALQPVLLPRTRSEIPDGAPVVTVDLEVAPYLKQWRDHGRTEDGLAVVLAAFGAYLARITGAETFDLGLRDIDRVRRYPDRRLFAEDVPFRVGVAFGGSFAGLVGGVAAELTRSRRRGTYFTDLPAREPSLAHLRTGLAHAVRVEITDAIDDAGTVPPGTILALVVDEGGNQARWLADPSALDPAVLSRMTEEFATLLAAGAAEPDRSVGTLALLPDAERRKILGPFNDVDYPFDHDAALHQLVERQAARTPDRVAVRCAGETLTYHELNQRANRLAHHLVKLGVQPTHAVGIFMARSLDMVVAQIAALKASGAYVPLDPGYPVDRTQFMIADGTLHVVLAHRDLAPRLPEHGAQVVCVDDDPAPDAGCPTTNLDVSIDPAATAYVIYTSGSTGRPKGVLVPHRGVVNLLEVMAREPGLGPDDHMLSIAPIAFDMSVVEIFLPLSVGAQVEILPREVAEDGERLVAHLVASKATAMNATPTSYRLMVESGWPRTPGFTAMSGGEPMPRELANAILERADELWNLYGPTETTVYCTTGWNVPKGDAPLHVGIPMANTRAYVVDPRLELLPIGVPGELAIGGVCVARGYHARPDLTAERFIERSFDGGPAQRLYRSGDICRWKEDGTIEVLGRIDHQVKIRGFRVELGEIEGVIDQHPAVRGTVVMAREDTPGDKRLVAYMVLDDLGRAEESLVGEVRDRVREALPAYMMPAAFVVLDRFTRTANGKIDRKALPAPKETATRAAGEFRAPATPLETAIAEVWQEVIGVEQVGVDDDYFDLGGHSLLVQRIRNGLEERIGRGISTVELYRHPTVAKLAAYFEGADPDGRPQDTAGTGSQDDGVAVVTRSRFYRLRMTTQRFLLPGFVVSLYYYLRDRATVSPRAEVELSPLLRFGRGSVVGSYAKIKATAGPVVFGERCGIGNASFITGDEKGILIGDNFVCGPNTTIISSTYVHDRLDVHIWDQGLVSTGIRIGHNVWIGASVTVLDGTELGDNTIVVANSVVDRKHPPNVVLRGNPAEVIGVRD